MTDVSELIERLEDEAMRLQGRSIDRGCVDSGLSANLASEAADALQSLSDRVAVLREKLDDVQQAEGEYRLMHDRHGDGSQAAGRAWDLLRRAGDNARAALKEGK